MTYRVEVAEAHGKPSAVLYQGDSESKAELDFTAAVTRKVQSASMKKWIDNKGWRIVQYYKRQVDSNGKFIGERVR